MKLGGFVLVLALCACGEVQDPNKLPDAPTIDAPPTDGEIDAPDIDAPPPRCDPSKAFGTPVAVTELNLANINDTSPALTADELTLTFSSTRGGGLGATDSYITTRASRTAPWGAPVLINGVNTAGHDSRAHMTADQLSMYLEHNAMATGGEYNIVVSTRASTGSAFATPVAVTAVNTVNNNDTAPYVLPDHSAMYLVNTRMLWRSARTGTTFGAPVVVAGTNLQAGDFDYPFVAHDELTLYFATTRGPNMGGMDIWKATRSSVVAGFNAPVVVPELSSNRSESPGWVSADDCVIYFHRDLGVAGAAANYEIFRAEKPL